MEEGRRAGAALLAPNIATLFEYHFYAFTYASTSHADASFAWTFDMGISGTRYMTFRSVEKDLGRNRPQIRKGLGLIRARFLGRFAG